MLKRKVLIPLITVVVGFFALVGVGGASIALAQSGVNTPITGLAQAIAQKFGLNATDVQNAISQYRQTQGQQMEKNRLDRLVSAGKITSAQETAILNEIAKLQSEYPKSSLQGMTPEQRQQTLQKERVEVQAWATANNINSAYLMGGFGGPGFGHFHGKGRFNGPNGPLSITPTPNA